MLHAKNCEARNPQWLTILIIEALTIKKVLHGQDHVVCNFQSNAPIVSAKWFTESNLTTSICIWCIGVGRGGARGGQAPPIIWEGGPTYLLAPPIIHPHFLQFLCETGKNHNCTKLKGKIIINITFIWFEGTCKTIPFNSILEFSII